MSREAFRTPKETWSSWIRICYALTNWNILRHPLRRDDPLSPNIDEESQESTEITRGYEAPQEMVAQILDPVDLGMQELSWAVDQDGEIIPQEKNLEAPQEAQ